MTYTLLINISINKTDNDPISYSPTRTKDTAQQESLCERNLFCFVIIDGGKHMVSESRLTRLTRDDSGISLIFGGTATKMLQISWGYPGGNLVTDQRPTGPNGQPAGISLFRDLTRIRVHPHEIGSFHHQYSSQIERTFWNPHADITHAEYLVWKFEFSKYIMKFMKHPRQFGEALSGSPESLGAPVIDMPMSGSEAARGKSELRSCPWTAKISSPSAVPLPRAHIIS